MSYTVGQLAKLTGLTVRALHHYDAIGLLVPSQRSSAGYRLYTQADTARLFRIQALRGIGLSLAEVQSILSRDAGDVGDLIAQQIETLDEQIEHASGLRTRLLQLQELLKKGAEPQASDWVAAIELVTQYGKYCSPEELHRLIRHYKQGRDEGAQLIRDLEHALATKLAPDSQAASELLNRWSELLLKRVGGDLQLAVKMKHAYTVDSDVRARVEAQTQWTPEMMYFLGKAFYLSHRAFWAKHLEPADLQSLCFLEPWHPELLPTIAELSSTLPSSEPQIRAQGYARWRKLLDLFTTSNVELIGKVEATICDPKSRELRRLWLISDELCKLIERESAAWIDASKSDRALRATLQ